MEEKKSIFIATCARVENEEEAQAFLQKQRQRYPDANHHVYAWVIGGKSPFRLQRFSDDGEPQGTSGPPVLDVLVKGNIVDTIIVVTRYFGGTLLGTGGLVKAYGQAASSVVQSAGLVEHIPAFLYHLRLAYRFVDHLTHQLGQVGIEIKEKNFLADVQMSCAIPVESQDAFIKLVEEICLGQAQITKGDPTYLTKKKGEI